MLGGWPSWTVVRKWEPRRVTSLSTLGTTLLMSIGSRTTTIRSNQWLCGFCMRRSTSRTRSFRMAPSTWVRRVIVIAFASRQLADEAVPLDELDGLQIVPRQKVMAQTYVLEAGRVTGSWDPNASPGQPTV